MTSSSLWPSTRRATRVPRAMVMRVPRRDFFRQRRGELIPFLKDQPRGLEGMSHRPAGNIDRDRRLVVDLDDHLLGGVERVKVDAQPGHDQDDQAQEPDEPPADGGLLGLHLTCRHEPLPYLGQDPVPEISPASPRAPLWKARPCGPARRSPRRGRPRRSAPARRDARTPG